MQRNGRKGHTRITRNHKELLRTQGNKKWIKNIKEKSGGETNNAI